MKTEEELIWESYNTKQIINNPNFKKWFGDSKVVDKNGDPLLVYHGTNITFDVFDIKKIGNSTGTAHGAGFYFAEEKNIAGGYSKNEKNIIEAYLSIQKPLDSNSKSFNLNQLIKIIDNLISIEIEKYPDENINYKDTFISNYTDTYTDQSRSVSVRKTASIIHNHNDNILDQIGELWNTSGKGGNVFKTIKNTLGYDSVKIRDFQNSGSSIYVVWEPTQIKSIYNNGNFDPNNPNITK